MIIVSSLKDMPNAAARAQVSDIVSLIQPEFMPATPAEPANVRHLKIAVDDITGPQDGMIAPVESHVTRLLNFFEDWSRTAPILIHCYAGVSRSMAAAYTLLNILQPDQERDVACWLRRHAAHALPNRLIVSHADRLLNRQGRMVAALDDMGPAEQVIFGGPVTQIPLASDQPKHSG